MTNYSTARTVAAVASGWSGSRVRLLVAAVVGFAVLAPGQVRSAHAAVTVAPAFVKNLSKVTLSMSGYNSAHDTLAPAGAVVVQVSGPASGASLSYGASNVHYAGGKLLADVNFATGTLGAGPGTYTVKVCESSCTGSLPWEDAGTFTVVAAPLAVDPPAAPLVVALASTTTVILEGSFARGATVYTDSPALQIGTATPVDGTHLQVPVTTTASTPPGLYNLTARNTDGTQDSCYRCLRVANFQLNSVAPTALPNAPGARSVTVHGLDVPVGTQLVGALTREPAITGQDVIRSRGVEALDATDWSGFFDLADAAPGSYRLSLTAEDASTVGVCACLLTVYLDTPPAVTSVSPGSVGQGAKDFALTVHGSNFTHGSLLSVPTSAKVTVGDTHWVDDGTLTTTVLVDPVAPAGKVDVTVTIPGTPGSFTCSGCLVVNPRPSINGASPDTLTQGDQRVRVTLTGEQFSADTRLSTSRGITLDSVVYVDTRNLIVTVSVDTNAPGGVHTVTASNPDGSSSGAVSALVVDRVVLTTITATPATVGYGGAVVLSGSAYYRDSGEPVTDQLISLMASTGGAMEALDEAATDSAGVWRYRHVPTGNTSYQVAVSADGAAPATSKVLRVTVAARLALTSPRASTISSVKTPLTIAGTISPAGAGRVTVYAKDVHGRVRSVAVTPGGNGSFTTRLSLPAGTYRLWAESSATSRFVSGMSTAVTVRRR